jgi:hypothetical protein
MTTTIIWAARALLLISTWSGVDAEPIHCGDMLHVKVQLINEAGVSPHDLTKAEREAAWLLLSLCVQLTWSSDGRGQGLEIHILPVPLVTGIDTSCLGVALPTLGRGNHAAVLMSHVQEVVAKHRDLIDTKTLLGHVLAHELGHLLLHTKTHSESGIMQANFGEFQLRMAYQRRLIFTESDRRHLLRNRNIAEAQTSSKN